jgi:hypothetical protein
MDTRSFLSHYVINTNIAAWVAFADKAAADRHQASMDKAARGVSPSAEHEPGRSWNAATGFDAAPEPESFAVDTTYIYRID